MPDAQGVKPYKLLVDAMTELNKVAIGRIIVRSKERLVAIRPLDGMLCIETMRYADEVLPRDELVPDEDVELTDRERAMARQLVESLAVDEFEPEKFHDEYREQVLDLIERKAAGEEIVAEPVVEAAGQGARPRRRARSVAREGGAPPRTATRASRRGARSRRRRPKAPAKKAAKKRDEARREEAARSATPSASKRAALPWQRPHLGERVVLGVEPAAAARTPASRRPAPRTPSQASNAAADQVVRVCRSSACAAA